MATPMPTPVFRPDPERDGVDATVLATVQELVEELGSPRASVTLDDRLDRDLGLGSLERVELLVRLERSFGARLPEAALEGADTPRDLVEAVLAVTPLVARRLPERRPAVGGGVAAPATAATLVDVLRWHADAHPDRPHVFLTPDGGPEETIGYGTLLERASAFAAALRENGLQRGETVALMLRTEAAFLFAFFGTLLAGGIPVPIYPPFRLDRLEEYVERQAGILTNAEVRFVLTFAEVRRVAALLGQRVPSLRRVIVTDDLPTTHRGAGALGALSEGAALIQYTSGSTGAPKGVFLAHANILANIRAIGCAIAISPDDVAVSWLPLYHDMGLIGMWLGALYFGVPVAIFSPLAFLARPSRWLLALHRHRGTISAGPNFAFELCAQRIADEELEGLDLSAWRLAMNGSEPVSADTLARFAARFAPYGFRPTAMSPVYGLAEASVALTMPPPGRGPRLDRIERRTFEQRREARAAETADASALTFVSCGGPIPDHEVRVVDADGRPRRERHEGRVLFRGPSVTSGYFRNPQATRAVVRDGWMDSGDLGYLADGELFVTGRAKDVIIKAGRNLYPQEVEEVVGRLSGIRKGCVAAFAVPAPEMGTERLVVVAESRQRSPEARERLRVAAIDAVVAVLGIPPDAVVIADPGTVLKTPSGKIRRSATRDAYRGGTLGRARSSTAVQLVRLLARDAGARLGGALRAAAFAARVGAVLLVALPALAVAARVVPRGRAVNRVARRWARALLRLGGIPLRVEGLEHVPASGPAVLVANHTSYTDAVVLLAALPADFRFVAKRELLRTPIVRTIIRRGGHLAIERGELSRSVADARRAAEALRERASVLFFPEGTFVRAPGLLPFRLGAFAAAVETGAPVVPVTLAGPRDLLPAGTWRPRPASLTVTIGAPIAVTGTGWTEIVRLRDAARAAIAGRLGV